jgi:hypothetical protein
MSRLRPLDHADYEKTEYSYRREQPGRPLYFAGGIQKGVREILYAGRL